MEKESHREGKFDMKENYGQAFHVVTSLCLLLPNLNYDFTCTLNQDRRSKDFLFKNVDTYDLLLSARFCFFDSSSDEDKLSSDEDCSFLLP